MGTCFPWALVPPWALVSLGQLVLPGHLFSLGTCPLLGTCFPWAIGPPWALVSLGHLFPPGHLFPLGTCSPSAIGPPGNLFPSVHLLNVPTGKHIWASEKSTFQPCRFYTRYSDSLNIFCYSFTRESQVPIWTSAASPSVLKHGPVIWRPFSPGPLFTVDTAYCILDCTRKLLNMLTRYKIQNDSKCVFL